MRIGQKTRERACQVRRILHAYHQRGFATAASDIWLRSGVAAALDLAACSLPVGLNILVWDGLRTLETQREIIERFRASVSHLDIAERDDLCRRYVSPLPATADAYCKAPPPHTTGGAVDVTLCDHAGCPLDLGADFDEFEEIAWLTAFEGSHASKLAEEDVRRRNRRRTLYWAMIGASFAAYKWEFWHFELGTRRAAASAGSPAAVYGGIAYWPQEWSR